MSCAHHLADHPDKFDVTIVDAVDYCGGQAFSIPLDKDKVGASWMNQGVQGGSYIFHHTLTMFSRLGYRADPVKLQVSFGKDDTFWTNVYPTKLLAKYQKEIGRFTTMLKVVRWFELFFCSHANEVAHEGLWISYVVYEHDSFAHGSFVLGNGKLHPRSSSYHA